MKIPIFSFFDILNLKPHPIMKNFLRIKKALSYQALIRTEVIQSSFDLALHCLLKIITYLKLF